jgi:hypothetical protein
MLFERYIGIDYSGAATPTTSLKGLRIYMANRQTSPYEIMPPASPRKYWTRRNVAEWLIERLGEAPATIVGIDHGFSFPLQYFERHRLPLNWPMFLEDFHRHWPTDEDHVYVDFVRDGLCGSGAERDGDRRWRRLTEIRSGGAKSVFHFDVQGSVAKSTHAGLPWLHRIRQQFSERVHFWPFDGWQVPPGRHMLAEIYPALWSAIYPCVGCDPHQQDAFAVAAWLRDADSDDSLAAFMHPALQPAEQKQAEIEGWILGVA